MKDKYLPLPGGSLVRNDPSLRGQRVILDSNAPRAYAISEDDLERGTVHIGQEQSPIQQLVNGAENRTLRFWRPVIWSLSPIIMLPAVPVTSPLPISVLTRGQIFRGFIGPYQRQLLSIVFKEGRIPAGLYRKAVEAYLEIAKKTIIEGIDKGEQTRRITVLLEVLEKMK